MGGEGTNELGRWVEVTAHHAIATMEDVVFLVARVGSAGDPTHIRSGSRAVDSLHRERGAPVKLLFALADAMKTPPPNEAVRLALAEAIRRNEGQLRTISLLIPGAGFGPSMHRAVISGLMALRRKKVPVQIHSDPRSAFAQLFVGEGVDTAMRLYGACIAASDDKGAATSAPPMAQLEGKRR